jgi:hypothetical protein
VKRARILAAGVAVLLAAPSVALAQADNSNSLTAQDRVVVASVERGDMPSILRRWFEDRRPRDTHHAGREGLTAAEIGLLYGGEFAFGAGAEGPVPVPAP